ncbi:MAG: hypothetical protein ACRDTH_00830 [Pseudonocardiaceae bacterium]
MLAVGELNSAPKAAFSDTALYNAGVKSQAMKAAMALLTKRIFELFAGITLRELPASVPLRISGGRGLNCDWNAAWWRPRPLRVRFRPTVHQRFRPGHRHRDRRACASRLRTTARLECLQWHRVHPRRGVRSAAVAAAAGRPAVAGALARGRVVAWVSRRSVAMTGVRGHGPSRT